MNCPRCGEKNQENNNLCSGCGLKLKISCPECSALNKIGKERCTKCGFRLILVCPECRALNHYNAKNCRKCDLALFIECKKCDAENYISEKTCIRCDSPLNEADEVEAPIKPEEAPVQSSNKQDIPNQVKKRVLNPRGYIVLAVELTNFTELKVEAKSDVFILKMLKKFYQIIVTEAKKKTESVKKISDQLITIEFRDNESLKIATINAVITAQRILEKIREFNSQLNVELEVITGVSLVDARNRNSYSQHERAVANAGEVIINKNLNDLIADMFESEEIYSSGDMTSCFYKLMEAEKQQDESGDADKSQVDNDASDISENKISRSSNDIIKAKQKMLRNRGESSCSEIQEVSQESAYNFILDIIKKGKKGYAVGISGPSGIGKSTAISTVRQTLSSEKITWLIGLCQPANQVTPFSFFQDLLKTIMSLPPLILNVAESKKVVAHFLDSIGIKNKQTEEVLNRLLFQESLVTDIATIFDNQREVNECVKTILGKINLNTPIVLIIDDLEYIDIASLDCIKYLINSGFLNQGSHIIATHSADINFNDYLFIKDYQDRVVRLHLSPMVKEEMEKALLGMLNNQDVIPEKLKEQIFTKSKGSPLYLEQVLWLLFQTGTIYPENNVLKFNMQAQDIQFPAEIDRLISMRLAQINSTAPDSQRVIMAAGLFGQRFIPATIQPMLGMDQEQFTGLMQILLSSGILVNFDNHSILFKHRAVWETIYKQWQFNDQRAHYHNMMLEMFKSYIQAPSAMVAIHAELAGNYEQAIEYWNKGSIEAISTGDVQAYTTAQKQVLGLLDRVNLVDETEKERIKTSLYENIGKLNYEINPSEAVEYLCNAIVEKEKSNEIIQVIELTGYLSKSCELIGNYSGIVECVDKALSGVDKNNLPLEYALLSYSKLEALYNLGRLEEAVIIAKTVVIPILGEFVAKGNSIKGLDMQELLYIEVDSWLVLAKIFACQGNKETVDAANSAAKKAKELGFIEIEVKAHIIEAFHRIIQGRSKSANSTLIQIRELLPQVKNHDHIKLYWGFVNALSNIFNGNSVQAGKLYHSLLELAEECKEYSLHSIIKLLIARSLFEVGKVDKAAAICNELITYCSENKMATGALLGWYLYSEMEMQKENITQSSSVAERALEVAQKASINNHLFTILLQQLLADIQILNGDYELARIYIEKAIALADKVELYYFQSELYLVYGRLMMKAASRSAEKDTYLENSSKFYAKALDIAKMIENDYLVNRIQQELSESSLSANNVKV